MSLPRIIPTLLLSNYGLVKTVNYKSPNYLGDPVNAVKIFNDKNADEIILLDIQSSVNGTEPNYSLIKKIAGEAFMPFTYGGGIRSVEMAKRILASGAEKVSLNTINYDSPRILTELSKEVGSQSVVGAFDVRKDWFGRKKVYNKNRKEAKAYEPLDYARILVDRGAGELFITDVDREGTYKGYDIEFFATIAEKIDVPVVCNGGCNNRQNIKEVFQKTEVSGCAVGSLFLYSGPHKAFLLSYWTYE